MKEKGFEQRDQEGHEGDRVNEGGMCQLIDDGQSSLLSWGSTELHVDNSGRCRGQKLDEASCLSVCSAEQSK